jgi:hypothetical protein
MTDSQNNALEDLAFIKQVISDSKKTVLDSGTGFIIWGIIVVTGLLYTYFDVIFDLSWDNDIIWFILIGGGWFYTIWTSIIQGKKRKVSTLSGKILGAVWLSSGIAMTILGFVGTFTGAYNGVYISPLISTVLGVAFLISGVLFEQNWISYLSIAWWAGAIYMFSFPTIHVLLIMALMMLFLQVLPGVLMYRHYKNEISKNS